MANPAAPRGGAPKLRPFSPQGVSNAMPRCSSAPARLEKPGVPVVWVFDFETDPSMDPVQRAASLVAEMTRELDQTRLQPLMVRKRIFRDLQRQLHPDKNVDQEEAAKLAFQQLMERREAYLR